MQACIDKAVADGATAAATAPVPDDGGYWVAPTLFTGVTPEMAIARDEVFGPVTAVLPFADEDEAVDLANDTPYGLLAAVYTADHPRALRVARRIDAGVVLLNNFNRALLGTPFGGFKDSGYGREHSVESMLEFTRIKNIREPSGAGPIPEWPVLAELFGDEKLQSDRLT